jgi:FkbM family methyltransferase
MKGHLMQASIARRAVGDIISVCRSAYPAAAARWVTSLLTCLPECASARSLSPADRAWAHAGARFRTPTGAVISLPAAYTAGAREMYCRNVYFRTGLTMPAYGWIIDLGANSGLFSVWAALTGAQVVAVEAQHGYAAEIRHLAACNGVGQRVHVEIALASGVTTSGAAVGVLADDHLWSGASHSASARPADISVPQIMSAYRIDRLGLLKMDIEGGEFAVLGDNDLSWLTRVDQLVLEVHRDFGQPAALVEQLRRYGFTVDMRDVDGRVTPTAERADYAYCRR